MPINAERLIAARNAKGWSQADLASRVKLSQQAIGKLESGTAKSSKHIARIAAALGVEVGHLDPDYDLTQAIRISELPKTSAQRDSMPLYASAEASNGDGALILSAESIEDVPRPHVLEKVATAYAILIEGESMDPAFEPGDKAWVNPMLGLRRNEDVVLYCSDDMTGERRAIIKRLVTWNDTHWTLRQYNPPRDFKLERDPWRICHRIIGKISKGA